MFFSDALIFFLQSAQFRLRIIYLFIIEMAFTAIF